jgi:hypothetical protein
MSSAVTRMSWFAFIYSLSVATFALTVYFLRAVLSLF